MRIQIFKNGPTGLYTISSSMPLDLITGCSLTQPGIAKGESSRDSCIVRHSLWSRTVEEFADTDTNDEGVIVLAW